MLSRTHAEAPMLCKNVPLFSQQRERVHTEMEEDCCDATKGIGAL